MRALIAIAVLALLGAGALGYAWHLLGKVPPRAAAAPSAVEPALADEVEATELVRVPVEDVRAEEQANATTRAPLGLEEGGAAPLRRDYAAIYSERTIEERRAALVRLGQRIELSRQRLGQEGLDELAGRRGNAPTSPGVQALLNLIEERAWLQSSLAPKPAPRGEDAR